MKNKSSVQYIIDGILYSNFQTDKEWIDLFEKANKMFEDEIINAFHQGRIQFAMQELERTEPLKWIDIDSIQPFKEGKDYFDKTFSYEK